MTANRSILSPLRIDAVTVPGTNGVIGMTIFPGKDEYYSLGSSYGLWNLVDFGKIGTNRHKTLDFGNPSM